MSLERRPAWSRSGKHADLAPADPVQLDQRGVVKFLIQTVGIGEEKVRAQHQVELTILEGQTGEEDRRRSARDVPRCRGQQIAADCFRISR